MKLTAQSEPINIPLETKKEIVLTLKMYPIILKERDLLIVKTELQEEIIIGLKNRIAIKDEIIDNRNEVIDLLIEESNIYAKKFRPKTFSMYAYVNTPFNSVQPQLGLTLIVKEKMFFSGGVLYDNLRDKLALSVGLGVKLF